MAALLIHEPFTHADGDIVGKVPLLGGAWAPHSAGANKVLVSSGLAQLVQGGSGREDVNSTFDGGLVMGAGDTLYAAMDVAVTAGSDMTGDNVFAHFLEGSSIFNGRVWATSAPGGGNFTFGVGGTGSSTIGTGVKWGSALTYGSTYRVVVAYDFDSGDSSLWVNPINQGSTSITFNGTFSDDIVAFALRQGTASAGAQPSQTIDNLCVATEFNEALNCIPEPGTISLLVLGALVALRRRK